MCTHGKLVTTNLKTSVDRFVLETWQAEILLVYVDGDMVIRGWRFVDGNMIAI